MRVLCYGVRDVERPIFESLNKEYGFNLTLVPNYLKGIDDAKLAEGHEAVILRGNCFATEEVLELYKSYGVKYLLTRTVGVNHIDLDNAEKMGFITGYVPSYSPNAIAELALSLAMMLLRHTAYTCMKTAKRDFTVDAEMFSKEIRNCTVGIIGTGKIGFTACKLFKGLGAKVLAYDIYKRDDTEDVFEYVELDELLAQSDVVSLHIPFIKENGKLVNREFISKMKEGAIIVNTSRGELQDLEAILDAVESKKLAGAALDTLDGEGAFFFKSFDRELSDAQVERAVKLYPRVLLTPHIGSYTDEAASNMIETSYINLAHAIKEGVCKYPIKK